MGALEEKAREVARSDEYAARTRRLISMAFAIANYYKSLIAAGVDKSTALYLAGSAQSEFWKSLEV